MTNWLMRTLTPVHVGTGAQLTSLDYLYDGEAREVIVLDFERVLARPEVDPDELSRSLQRTGLSVERLLRDQRIPPREVARYRLAAEEDPRGSAIREQLKTPWHQPLIPASSLKGAIRTTLLWRFLKEGRGLAEGARYLQEVAAGEHDRFRGGRSRPPDPRYIAQRLERAILGSDPNHDLLRALQIGDPEPLPTEALLLLRIDTYKVANGGRLQPDRRLTNYVEALKPGAQARLSLKLDEPLFAPQAEAELHFSRFRRWLDPESELTETLNLFAAATLEAEAEFYRRAGLEGPARWCRACLEDTRRGDRAIVCLGWGTGWHTKTVGSLFQRGQGVDFTALRRKLELGRSRSTGGYHPAFPKSRRLSTGLEGDLQPLGWLELTQVR